MFYAFRDRVESIGTPGSYQLGLVQFDQTVDRLLDLTPDLGAFENCVDGMKQRGSTAIYAAVQTAVTMLEPVAKKHPHTDLRVVLLTDGQNNQCSTTAHDAFAAANRVGVVVDAILVGDSVDNDLRKVR